MKRHTLLGCLVVVVAAHLAPAAEPEDAEQLRKRVTQLEAEVKTLREELAQLRAELKALTPPKSDKVQPLELSVIPGGWGDAPPENILAVCRSAANELWQYFPGRTAEPITIRHDPKQGPMVIYGKGKDGERRVLINAKDTHWAQFAFQFGHEFSARDFGCLGHAENSPRGAKRTTRPGTHTPANSTVAERHDNGLRKAE